MDENLNKYTIMFGFIIFVDMKKDFYRANSHVWLQDRKTKQWVDSSPLVDKDEVGGRQYLVLSSSMFTWQERVELLSSPAKYTLGAMINKVIIPEILQNCLVVNGAYETIGGNARDLRIMECGFISTGGNGDVLINMKQDSLTFC